MSSSTSGLEPVVIEPSSIVLTPHRRSGAEFVRLGTLGPLRPGIELRVALRLEEALRQGAARLRVFHQRSLDMVRPTRSSQGAVRSR